jgi:hypothetical protein
MIIKQKQYIMPHTLCNKCFKFNKYMMIRVKLRVDEINKGSCQDLRKIPISQQVISSEWLLILHYQLNNFIVALTGNRFFSGHDGIFIPVLKNAQSLGKPSHPV